MRLGLTIALTVALVLAPSQANTQPFDDIVVPVEAPLPMPSTHLRLKTGPGILIAPNGLHYDLPQGSHIITAPIWDALDADLKRLQEVETRITAENKSLRESANNWHPGWPLLAAAVGVGLVAGFYVGFKL